MVVFENLPIFISDDNDFNYNYNNNNKIITLFMLLMNPIIYKSHNILYKLHNATQFLFMVWRWMLHKNVFCTRVHLITYTKMTIVYDKSYRVDGPFGLFVDRFEATRHEIISTKQVIGSTVARCRRASHESFGWQLAGKQVFSLPPNSTTTKL